MHLKNVIELNFDDRDDLLEAFSEAPASYRAHAAGGLLVTAFIPAVAVVLALVLLGRVLLKHYDVNYYWCVQRAFEFMFYSLPLRMVLLTFLSFCIAASMGEIWCMVYCPFVCVSVYVFLMYTEPYELAIEST